MLQARDQALTPNLNRAVTAVAVMPPGLIRPRQPSVLLYESGLGPASDSETRAHRRTSESLGLGRVRSTESDRASDLTYGLCKSVCFPLQ